MSEVLFSHKQIEENGDIIEMKAWSVPVSSSTPEGVSYSMVYIRQGRRILGYDNENHGTGKSNHHRHIGDRTVPYIFVDVWKVVEDFVSEVEIIKRGLR